MNAILKTLTATTLLSSGLHVFAAPMVRIFELGVQPEHIARFDQAAHAKLTALVGREHRNTTARFNA